MNRHRFYRGAQPTPRHKLLGAMPFRMVKAPPPQAAWVPQKLDCWGNDQYGDCVTAEEAFAKATFSPELFLDSSTVISWASRHGFLNGAVLTDVLDAMQAQGFQVGSQTYNDGGYRGVDFSSETTLQAALSLGPVKIGIDADALPDGAGNGNGWYALGGGKANQTDHCVSLCGYGTASYLFQQLGVPLPAALPPTVSGYLLFTWGSIGFVDHSWILGTCTEAWIRTPTTVGVPPLTPPDPPAPPNGVVTLTFGESSLILGPGHYTLEPPGQDGMLIVKQAGIYLLQQDPPNAS